MRQIAPGPTGAPLDRFFASNLPTRPRCIGVLDGSLGGVIWADERDPPAWVVVTELADGTTYIGGAIGTGELQLVFGCLAPASGDIIIGFAGADDRIRNVLPADPYYRGEAIDFTDRVAPPDEERLLAPPEGLRVVDMDADLFMRTQWHADLLVAFGGVDRWRAGGIGRCLMGGDEIMCEAMAGPPIRGLMEVGVLTAEAHRGRGYATLTCRHVVRACESRGLAPWWNTSAGNAASMTVARRLGFSRERRYELVAYRAERFRAIYA